MTLAKAKALGLELTKALKHVHGSLHNKVELVRIHYLVLTKTTA